ncbi:hypothetical protein AS589_09305 [Empedobacter brevis]|uniref:hypothetical protein n=1 Tax=Empedobacter brevis TaxID=247 RepID=UPI00131FAB9D|nr:hypothetical protein [Empedobacter brevis]QHC84952.1 hypothetical protein AS589_09305 [Empedobacter brevis]
MKQTYEFPIIKDCRKNDVLDAIDSYVSADATLRGVKDENMPKDELLNDISDMIYMRFWMISVQEIQIALKMNRYGMFEQKSEHYQFVNSELIAEILGKYCKWKQKKAIEHNLSRKPASHQIEHQIDEEKINQEYQETILSELREGKTYRSINAHLLLKSVPNQFKPTQKQYYSLLEKEENILQKEKELKLTEQNDPLIAKKIIRNFNETLKLKAHQRVCNIIVCNWFYKTIIQNGT